MKYKYSCSPINSFEMEKPGDPIPVEAGDGLRLKLGSRCPTGDDDRLYGA